MTIKRLLSTSIAAFLALTVTEEVEVAVLERGCQAWQHYLNNRFRVASPKLRQIEMALNIILNATVPRYRVELFQEKCPSPTPATKQTPDDCRHFQNQEVKIYR